MTVRLGSIEFINSLPVDLGLLSGEVAFPEARIYQASPAVLNQKISEGVLDVSPISALWYAQHARSLFVLPDLSISSDSAVDSVLLFSKQHWSKLSGANVAISGKGRTTPVLFQILCRELFGFKPTLQMIQGEISDMPSDASAVLLIGDEALQFRENPLSRKYQVVDLAEEWKRMTGWPFVFALWVARKAFWMDDAEKVLRTHQAILKSKYWGLLHQRMIFNEAVQRSGLPSETVQRYFSKLSYGFDDKLKSGLRVYFELAKKHGYLNETPQLEMIDKDLALVS